METKAHYALVGFFAMALAAALAVFVLWFSQRSPEEMVDYEVVFEGAARGLTEASAVQFNGIRVGQVESLQLAGSEGRLVIARVRVRRATPVDCDTVGQLEPQGITGVNFIQLVPADDEMREAAARDRRDRPRSAADLGEAQDGPPRRADFSGCLHENESGERVPRLVGERSAIDDIIASGGGVVSDSQRLVALLTQQLSANSADIRRSVLETRGILQEFGANDDLMFHRLFATLDEVERTAASWGALAEDARTVLNTEIQPSLAQMRGSLEELDLALERGQTLIDSAADIVERSSDPAVESVERLAVASADLQALIARLDSIARQLEEDPGAFVSGPRRREVEIPQ